MPFKPNTRRKVFNTAIRTARALRAGYGLYQKAKPVIKAATAVARKISTRFRSRKPVRPKRNAMIRQKPYSAAGGQGTFSKFNAVTYPTPQIKALKRVGAANSYITNNSKQLLVPEGFQGASQFAIQSNQDLRRLYDNVVGNTARPPNSPYQKRFVLESTHAEYMLTNSSLATAYVDIYDIVRRRDASTDISTGDPVSAWDYGAARQLTAGVYSPYAVLNSVPTDSQTFRDWFKVVKRTHISLGTGATHKHSVYLKPNKMIDGSELYLTSPTYGGDLAGVTMYTMIVAYGQPASAPNAGETDVTTAKLAIDVVRAIRYKYTFVQNTDDVITYSDGLLSLAGEQIANAGSGTITANAVV